MSTFQHPTGGNPKKINIVALGPTSNTYNGMSWQYTSQIPAVDETWTVNKGFRTLHCDLVFIMDDLIGEARKSKQYYDDIDSLKIPVITSVIDSDVMCAFPMCNLTAYPFNDVLNHIGVKVQQNRNAMLGEKGLNPADVVQSGSVVGNYLHNSIPFMLAYALFIGVTDVHLFGCDYTFPGSDIRESDRANTEYWVGLLRAYGVNVIVTPDTTLLNQRMQPHVYGYGARLPQRQSLNEVELKRYMKARNL